MSTPTVLTDDVQGTPTPCPAGLFPTPRGFYGTSPMVQVCWQDQYQNKFFDTVGSRLVSMVGWRQGLRTTFHAVSGQSANPKRDLILGADSYRERYTAGSTHRYEAMRAVRSVYQGTSFVVNDDFPDVLPNAPILPIRGQGWVPIWWGNGQSDYPNSEDMADIDTVLVRGAAGHRFEIEASGLIASTAPAIDLWRVDGATPKFIQSSLTGSLQTSALAVTAWYMVAFVPQSVGSWQARMRHLTGSDDFSGDVSEAWPLVHDVALDAQATDGDTDAFAFDIPSSALGSSLTLTINAPFASAITVGERLGTSWSSVGTWSVSAGTATVTVPVGSNVSRFAFALSASGDGAYTVRANLACASATAPCDVSQAPSRAAVNAWGDRFAGRLDGATNIHEFTIDLAEGDNVSVSVTDNDLACRPRIELFPADVQRHFLDAADVMQPVFVWDDGAPVNHVSADTVGAGGHFEAASAGTYRIRVRPGAAACPWYRMHIAKVYPSLDARPAW